MVSIWHHCSYWDYQRLFSAEAQRSKEVAQIVGVQSDLLALQGFPGATTQGYRVQAKLHNSLSATCGIQPLLQ